MTTALPTSVIRYGVDRPLPEQRALRAGPVTAILENGDLRYVRAGGVEIVRRLYMAVRDRNWHTVEPRFTAYEVREEGDGFVVTLAAEHRHFDVDFAWEGRIEGRPDGTIVYAMDGEPRQSFLKNRIGFCVLHPMDLAGQPAAVETPEGQQSGAFPDLISPHQPFIDMVSIAHPAGSGHCTIRFEGDLFEMEDQRNWTDASYKTYGTPLRLPYPVRVEPGQRIVQTVTISVEGVAAAATDATTGAPDVSFAAETAGTLPAIGFTVASHGEPRTAEETERLQALQPAHLHLDVDLGAAGWRERFDTAIQQAHALGTDLEIGAVATEENGGFADLATALAPHAQSVSRLFVFPSVKLPIVFPRDDLATHPETIRAAKEAFAAAGVDVPLGGGTRAYFTELNRATDFLPVDGLDVVSYTLNPQVHAFDNASIVETLAAQAETVRSARAIVGDRPLAVGPITLLPPFNPNATGPEPEPAPGRACRRRSIRGSLALRRRLDWSGSIYAPRHAGVDALTYFETTGWRGLIERADHPLRVRHLPFLAARIGSSPSTTSSPTSGRVRRRRGAAGHAGRPAATCRRWRCATATGSRPPRRTWRDETRDGHRLDVAGRGESRPCVASTIERPMPRRPPTRRRFARTADDRSMQRSGQRDGRRCRPLRLAHVDVTSAAGMSATGGIEQSRRARWEAKRWVSRRSGMPVRDEPAAGGCRRAAARVGADRRDRRHRRAGRDLIVLLAVAGAGHVPDRRRTSSTSRGRPPTSGSWRSAWSSSSRWATSTSRSARSGC